MIRFNYLADVGPKPFPPFATTIAIDNRVRGPLLALAATLLLTGAVGLVQLSRLHAAQRGFAAVGARLAESNAAVAAIKRLQARVDMRARLLEQIADIRRASVVQANELAWIGNHLPRDTWLSALRYDNGNYSLEGTSEHVAAVGNAIVALHASGTAGVPRLVSLRDDASTNTRHIHYTLRLEARP